ncbi:hypothetical protein [Spirosoma sordidisoli]|uniref:Uncharacterized protein n=1 Tax=Spirosoma sordidisoli TaxID=2502893 RepID=A0A4Q2UBJ8_9BACT|nr:hypothetical protein [Spirosoma sordidisoli]RYC66307.1 hypothetical protein EQG79_29985 [Spirosoma sordidisoli]
MTDHNTPHSDAPGRSAGAVESPGVESPGVESPQPTQVEYQGQTVEALSVGPVVPPPTWGELPEIEQILQNRAALSRFVHSMSYVSEDNNFFDATDAWEDWDLWTLRTSKGELSHLNPTAEFMQLNIHHDVRIEIRAVQVLPTAPRLSVEIIRYAKPFSSTRSVSIDPERLYKGTIAAREGQCRFDNDDFFHLLLQSIL